jgi:hypothetical protein
MKRLALALILALPSWGAITFFGSASQPADNGAQAGPTSLTITPPGSMVAGDLVYILGLYRAATVTITIGDAGGQSWTSETNRQGSSLTARVFWARFNGTWSTNPTITNTTGTLALTAVMVVFRPTTGTNVWAIDQAEQFTAYTAPSTPFTVTRTGQTTAQADTVTIAAWTSADDNTWNTLSGAGWTALGTAQFRNTTGSDTSASIAYKIQTVSGATGNVSQNQATLGGDAGITDILTLYESAPPATTGTGWYGQFGWN